MRYVSSLLVLAVVPCLGFAQPTLEIPPEQLKPVNGYVIIDPKGSVKAVTYISLSNAYPVPSQLFNNKKIFVLPVVGLAKGKYDFIAVGSLNDEHVTVAFSVLLETNPPPVPPNPGPSPGPNPGPNPDPTPDPINLKPIGETWIAVVEETGQRTPDVAAVMGDLKYWQSLPVAGYRFYDKDNVTGDRIKQSYIDLANRQMPKKKAELPFLMVVDSKGNFIDGIPLPKKTDDITSFLKKTVKW